MKKILTTAVMLIFLSVIFTGCKEKSNSQNSVSSDFENTDAFKAVLLVGGNLGDKSFFDAANAGMLKAEAELSSAIKVIEMGTDKTKYEPTFRDICAQNWDLIITGGPDMTDILNQYAADYAHKTFMNYDASNDVIADNVYSVAYSANELSYLSGVLAALVTNSGNIENMNEDAKIGFIGGMDIPGINDFLVGYIQGAKDINPNIKIVISYAQDFGNPAKGKELALNQYHFGVDVIFSAAGGTGLGILDAAKELGLYAIGVDSDQALLFADTDPVKANQILSSAIKRIDQVVFNSIKACEEGTLPVGTYEVLGFNQEGVGIAKNEIYERQVPENIRNSITEIEQQLMNGDIQVITAIGMLPEELDNIRKSVAP
ncbi:MAG: BMP family ABC transporter substrate-binding protein [Spirochaetales bacterium]